jgi:hypothetical protein
MITPKISDKINHLSVKENRTGNKPVFTLKCNTDKVSFSGGSGKVIDNIFNNKFFQWLLEKAENNASLFAAFVVLIASTTARPFGIAVVPGAKKEDKNYAIAKSVATGVVSFGFAYAVFNPIEKAIKKFGKELEKITNKVPFKANSEELQIFNHMVNQGTHFITAPLVAFLMIATISPVVNYLFKKEKKSINANNESFKNLNVQISDKNLKLYGSFLKNRRTGE